jgi:hypothetical protein
VLAAGVADLVLVAPGVRDDDKDLVDEALDEDELPPQPVSITKAVSVTVTTAKRRRTNESSSVGERLAEVLGCGIELRATGEVRFTESPVGTLVDVANNGQHHHRGERDGTSHASSQPSY